MELLEASESTVGTRPLFLYSYVGLLALGSKAPDSCTVICSCILVQLSVAVFLVAIHTFGFCSM